MKLRNRAVNGFKVCPKCSENKSIDDYFKGGKYRMSWCKLCCKSFKPQNSEYFKKYYLAHKEHRKFSDKLRRYAITKEEFQYLFKLQNNRCAICKSDSPGKQDWAVDHDHNCVGKVRGILCNPCNLMLGLVKDNPETLLRASFYLDRQFIS